MRAVVVDQLGQRRACLLAKLVSGHVITQRAVIHFESVFFLGFVWLTTRTEAPWGCIVRAGELDKTGLTPIGVKLKGSLVRYPSAFLLIMYLPTVPAKGNQQQIVSYT